jgi:hypothetical protein
VPTKKQQIAVQRPITAIDDESSLLQDQSVQPQPIDLTGCYKLIENRNFEPLLQAQGVPWFLVSAANKARPTHNLRHRGDSLNIQIQGIIESETLYVINGPSIETNIRGRSFRDTMTYLKKRNSLFDSSGEEKKEEEQEDSDIVVGVQTSKRAVDDGYTITVQRRLSDDKTQIVMTSLVEFDDPTKPNVQCKQIFQRI